jgi:hypothetical protein
VAIIGFLLCLVSRRSASHANETSESKIELMDNDV